MQVSAHWLSLPIVIPLVTAALGLPFLRWGFRSAARWQRRLALVGLTANLLICSAILSYTLSKGRLVLQMGQWPAPYGITFVADGLAAFMLTLSAILALATLFYAMGTLDQRERMNYYPLTLFLVMGVNGAFLAGDVFNLYVFFEVLLMASFALLTLGGQIGQINGGIRYVVLNLLASTIFLATASLLYGSVGTLNMAQAAQRLETAPDEIRLLMAGLLFVSFGSKAGIFPLFFWLPASYHTPHPAVTALFGGLLTKVGIYTLLRVFPILFPDLLQSWQPLFMTIAGLTMVTGVLGAMAVSTMRRVLNFHIVSQVGYMVMGLGLAASNDYSMALFGMTASIFCLVHHMVVKTALLMAGGAAEIEVGSGSLNGPRLAGLRRRRPILAFTFFVAAMSLAGIPPSSGFISKLTLLQGALTGSHWVIAAVSLLVGLLTLLNMVRLWQLAFWGDPTQPILPPAPLSVPRRRRLALSPIVLLVTLSLAIGLFGGRVFSWSAIAAEQVLDRDGYIAAVAPTSEFQEIVHDN